MSRCTHESVSGRCTGVSGHPPLHDALGRAWRHGQPEQGIWWSPYPNGELQQVLNNHHGPIPPTLPVTHPDVYQRVQPDTEVEEEGYTVELGGQTFTKAQWEAIQVYVEGRIAAAFAGGW